MTELTNPVNCAESTILIADDNAVTLQLLSTFMEKEGYTAHTCNNGTAALSLAREKQPDLIILDIMMPHMDGIETCKRLKKDATTQHIPVLFLTSKVESRDKSKAFDAGAVDYITKPFERPEVMARVQTHLKLKKAEDKLQNYTRWLEKVLDKEEQAEQVNPVIHNN